MNEVFVNDTVELAKKVTLYSFIGWIVALFMTQRLPDAADIDQSLFRQPMQQTVPQNEFHFPYKGQDIKVLPMADYEIYGLVVSHNDPSKWYSFDLTHDDLSLNTRDICIIWGSNVQTNDFHHIRFSNSDWMCNWSFGSNVQSFNPKEASNNHLITASDRVRRQIARLNVGDQIHISGKLVYYAEERWRGVMRQTSLSREDEGKNACETIYVSRLEVINSYNRVWIWMREICYWLCVITITLRTTLFFAPKIRFKPRMPKFIKRIIDLYKP